MFILYNILSLKIHQPQSPKYYDCTQRLHCLWILWKLLVFKSLISVAQWWCCFWVPFLVCKRKGAGGENLLVFLLLLLFGLGFCCIYFGSWITISIYVHGSRLKSMFKMLSHCFPVMRLLLIAGLGLLFFLFVWIQSLALLTKWIETLGFMSSSHLSQPSSWDYRHMLSCAL